MRFSAASLQEVRCVHCAHYERATHLFISTSCLFFFFYIYIYIYINGGKNKPCKPPFVCVRAPHLILAPDDVHVNLVNS